MVTAGCFIYWYNLSPYLIIQECYFFFRKRLLERVVVFYGIIFGKKLIEKVVEKVGDIKCDVFYG